MSAIVTWTRRHRLVAFFGLTFLLSWWSWPFYALDLAPTAFFPCGPLVAALVVIGVAEGRAGYRDLGARMIRWRVGWTWWLVAVGTPLAVLAVAAVANVAIWGAPAPVLATIAWSQIALGAAIRFVNPLDGPLGEEPGWRGYALPQLQARRSPLVSGVVLGVLVALWHLPLVATGMLPPVGLPITFAITLVYVWLFNRTGGSVLMTMVFHIAQGTVSYGALGFTGSRRRAHGLARRRALVRPRPRRGRARPPGVAGGSCGRRRPSGRASRPHADRRSARCRVGSLGDSGPAFARSTVDRQLDRPRAGGPSRRTAGAMAGDTVAWSRSGGGSGLVDRLAAVIHVRGVRLALWAAAAVAELAVLAPVVLGDGPADPIDVVLRLVGGSFAACGLIAWRRRPDSRSGLLMTATGFAFLLSALLREHDTLLAVTAASWLSDLWTLFFIPLVLTYCTGGRLRTAADRVLLGAVVVEIVLLAPLWLVFADDPATLLLALPDPAVAHVIDRVQRGLYLAISVGHGGRGRRALAGGVGAGPAGDAAERRRRGLPAAVGRAARRRPRRRRRAPRGPALDRGVLDRARAGGVPRRPAPLAAGPGRPGRPVRRARHHAARRPAGGAGAGAARPGVRDRLRRPGRRVRRRPRVAGRPARAGVGPVGRRGWRATASPVAALVYDRSLDDDPELVEAVGGAATIALENRLLHAQSDARLAELQASRQRLVTAADAERRRIERNLHDGAQQRLVTLALQLSLIQRRIRDDPGDAEQLVASASDELAAVARRAARARAGDPPGRARAGAGARARGAGPALAGTGGARRRAGAAAAGARSSSPRTSWRRRRWRTSPSTRAPPR